MMTNKQIAAGAFGISLLGISPIFITNLWENLDAHEIMVLQSPMSGELKVYTDPGIKYQGFGKVEKYPRRKLYAFIDESQKGGEDSSKKVRFNDGGHANLSGSVSWEMPLDVQTIIAIHKQFGSAEGVEQQAVAKMIDSAVYLAGPLMSSTESSGERRSELVQYINDQAMNGVYMTRVVEKDIVDAVTQERHTASTTEIVLNKEGQPRRQQGSILSEFGIKLMPLSITNLDYDQIVQKQIAERQNATTQVQISIAKAKRAEQDAITAAKEGEAKAAEEKWKQEAIKAQKVTEAEQNRDVAMLAADTAEAWKREQILRGEGEAQRRQLVMSADGALDKKLEAYIEVQKTWADAFSKYTGAMVPTMQMGGGTSTTALGGAQEFVNLMTMKAAKDLSLDMTVTGKK